MYQVYKKTGILFKILPCFLIVMYIVMILYGTSVYAASTQQVNLPDDVININFDDGFDDYKYYGVLVYACPVSNGSYAGSYFVYASNSIPYISGVKYLQDTNEIYRYTLTCDEEFFYLSAYGGISPLIYDGSTLEFSELYLGTSGVKVDLITTNDLIFTDEQREQTVITSTFNFDLKDVEGNLVFPGATQEVATVIPEKITSVDFSQVLQEVLGILLILLPVVILVISLMKAIKLLLRVLHQA